MFEVIVLLKPTVFGILVDGSRFLSYLGIILDSSLTMFFPVPDNGPSDAHWNVPKFRYTSTIIRPWEKPVLPPIMRWFLCDTLVMTNLFTSVGTQPAEINLIVGRIVFRIQPDLSCFQLHLQLLTVSRISLFV